MSSCPVCGKPVDPIRAPAVAVRDGKVISYCSKEHAAEAETRPTVVPGQQVGPKRPATDPAFRIPDADQKKNRKARTPASGVAQAAPLMDSGPVIEIIREPASGVVTSAGDVRRGVARPSASSMTSGAIQIADTGHLDDYVSGATSMQRNKGWLIALVVIALGGGVAAAYKLGMFGRAAAPLAQVAAVKSVVALVDAPVAAPITAADAIAKARRVLSEALVSDSPRVQRVAASALARTGDPAALTALAAALVKETSDIAKLDILYALARGGDKRGVDGLVAALSAPRRDVKLEAAHRLVVLGDKRAVETLANYLDVSQLRLGAAEQLAILAEPRAIKVLEAVRADEKASPDDKARAAIALGFAGKPDIAPALHDLLTDARFNAFAASALANLHDEAARPVLVKQLDVSSLRVAAARAWRRLDETRDALPLLPPLLTALASAKDTEQVLTAEEVLVLAGPPSWSAHE